MLQRGQVYRENWRRQLRGLSRRTRGAGAGAYIAHGVLAIGSDSWTWVEIAGPASVDIGGGALA